MKISDIRANAYSMPFVSPSFPIGPYHFVNREFFIITYRTDIEALRAVVPEPLTVTSPLVSFEFMETCGTFSFVILPAILAFIPKSLALFRQ